MKIITLGSYLAGYNVYLAQVQLLVGLKKKGIEVTVVGSFSDDIYKVFRENGIVLIEDHPRKSIDFKYIKRIRSLIKQNGYDIIHLFSGKTVKNGILSAMGLSLKVLVYFGSSSIYWYDPTAYLSCLSPRVDKILCNSKYVNKHMKRQLIGTNKLKSIKVYKGYNPEWFQDIKPFDYRRLNIPENSTIVCMAANCRKVKDVPTFLNSTYYLTYEMCVHFVLMGHDTDLPRFQKLKGKSPIKANIHILGYRNDATSLIKGADIYVQTSRSEGLGRAIAEAMCFSKPIIMTDAGGCTELIENGKSGFVVPKNSPKDLALRIQKMAKEKQLVRSMGDLARLRITEHFHIKENVRNVYGVYQNVTTGDV